MALSKEAWQSYLNQFGNIGKNTSTKVANNSSNVRNASDIKKKYYVKGIGWVENEPLTTTDENGQRVVQTSGVQRQGTIDATGKLSLEGGDRLAKAYDYAKSGLGDTLRRWEASRRSGVSTTGKNDSLNLFRHYKDEGLYTGDYAGFEDWLTSYLQTAEGETLDVSALTNSRGIATKTADGRQTYAGVERDAKNAASGGGGTSGSVWQKRGDSIGSRFDYVRF